MFHSTAFSIFHKALYLETHVAIALLGVDLRASILSSPE
jgi:hypothetical protein